MASGGEAIFTISPGEAQRALGLSASGLHRVVATYEDIFEPLEIDSRGAQIWTGAAVEALRRCLTNKPGSQGVTGDAGRLLVRLARRLEKLLGRNREDA